MQQQNTLIDEIMGMIGDYRAIGFPPAAPTPPYVEQAAYRAIRQKLFELGHPHATLGLALENAGVVARPDVEAMAEARAIAAYEASGATKPWTYLNPAEWSKWRAVASAVHGIQGQAPEVGSGGTGAISGGGEPPVLLDLEQEGATA